MTWAVEYMEEYEEWWCTLDEATQTEIMANILVLQEVGPQLKRPRADTLKASKHPNLRELRIQYCGDPYRVFYAFDPRRVAVLLLGGNKKGSTDKQFYGAMIPAADAVYARHLQSLKPMGPKK
ncbi:type II toxin-antitoxin system RelE/ParE family toxin [Dyella kyungheensis]|uniref:type II toxin-antitoxin system RelE/ParE family toxin n=1 Tax=Dyella kyungheensis TaxID=1242174 RepID=UPI003CEC192E